MFLFCSLPSNSVFLKAGAVDVGYVSWRELWRDLQKSIVREPVLLRACHCTSSWSLCRLPFFGIWRFVQPVWPMLPASCVLNDASCTTCGGLMQETRCCTSILCCALSDTLSTASSPPVARRRRQMEFLGRPDAWPQPQPQPQRSHRAPFALRTISAHSPPAPLPRARVRRSSAGSLF